MKTLSLWKNSQSRAPLWKRLHSEFSENLLHKKTEPIGSVRMD